MATMLRLKRLSGQSRRAVQGCADATNGGRPLSRIRVRKAEFAEARSFLVLMALHPAQDVIEHANRRQYVWPFVEHDAVGSLRHSRI